MTTPVIYQYQAQTTVPYVTVDQFKIYPTWMDVDNLVPGNATAGIQDAALADVLVAATQSAENYVGDMPMRAHLHSENTRTRATRRGRLYVHPEHIPVRSVAALSYGTDPSALTILNIAASPPWIENNGRQVSFTLSGQLFFTGPMLQFGTPPAPELETFVNWTYIAGWVSTVLNAPASQGATSLALADITGVLPGDQIRVWDDKNVSTETVYVAGSYVPPALAWPPPSGTVPLVTGTQFAHNAGVGVGNMPRPVQQAVVCYAIGLLMREDVSAEQPWAGTPMGPAMRRGEERGKAGGLLSEAERLLTRYVSPRWGN